MSLELDIVSAGRTRRVGIDHARVTIGKAGENDISLADDSAASHLHAMLERFDAGWLLSDLGSSNGTWLNGERIWSPRRLLDGDEIRVGQTRFVVRDPDIVKGAPTDAEAPPPSLTAREMDVLVALCRPLLARDMFTEPAPNRTIAEDLSVTPAAVKQHLANLYEKFGVRPDESSRRTQLANEALRRGAVSLADLSQPQPALPHDGRPNSNAP